jgi:hypothetical protein
VPAYWPGGVRHRGNVSPTRLRLYGTGESVTRHCRPVGWREGASLTAETGGIEYRGGRAVGLTHSSGESPA